MEIYEYLAASIKSMLTCSEPIALPDSMPIEQITDIAKRNHISFLLYSNLIKDCSINENVKAELTNCIKNISFVSLVQMTELNRISLEFEKSEIFNMPLKGAILKDLYPQPEMREMSDIDILLDMDSEEKEDSINRSFEKLGYSVSASIKHHDIYKKVPFMTVEAHRALYDKTVDAKQYDYFLISDRWKVCDGKKYQYEMSIEDFYVYMIAHAAKHFYAMGCGIRNLIDIYVYLEKYGKNIDWKKIEIELKECGIFDFEERLRELAIKWLSGEKLENFDRTLFDYMLDSGIYGKDENGIWNRFSDLEKGDITKFELKKWYYFPPLYYMCEYYPWLGDKPFLLPAAWFVRICRGVFLHKGKKKRKMMRNIDQDQIAKCKEIYSTVKLKFKS